MKNMKRYILYFALTLALPGIMGLDCTGDPLEDSTGLLYVLDNSNDAVYVYEDVTNLDGAQDPVRTISGEDTLIENPTAIAVDPRRNILYVADATQQKILVFSQASKKDGDAAPARTLEVVDGNPQLMFLDWENDILYVFDLIEQNILVFKDVHTLDQANPTQFFNIGVVASAIFVDHQRSLLYVGDPFARDILVFDTPQNLLGDPLPTAVLTRFDDDPLDDQTPEFEVIDSLAMNVPNNILYVSESLDQSIEIFDNASTLDGEINPDRILEGEQTELTDDMRFSLFDSDTLYVGNTQTTIAVYDNANRVDGDTAPNRVITVNPATRIRAFTIDNSN